LLAEDVYRGAGRESAIRGTVAPSSTVIDELQPRFEWNGFEGEDYQVALYANDQEVARSARQASTWWVVPLPLQRGKTYRWQVPARQCCRSVTIPSPPAPPAVFRVLDAVQHDELARAEAQYPHDDLLLGILYARAGILDRARRHLSRLPAGQKLIP